MMALIYIQNQTKCGSEIVFNFNRLNTKFTPFLLVKTLFNFKILTIQYTLRINHQRHTWVQ